MSDNWFKRLLTDVPLRAALERDIAYRTRCYESADAALRNFNRKPPQEQDPKQRAFLERNLAGARKALIDLTSQRAHPAERKISAAEEQYLRDLYHLDRFGPRGRTR